ncbi:MAG: diguanylate cyclase domain-containing protein [Leptolyngbyaceae cyanobacterium]
MSLASEQFSQPLVTSVFLDSYSSNSALCHALLELSQSKLIHAGDVEAAAAAIAYSVVKNLGTTSCQIWLYTDNRTRFRQLADYGTISTDTSAPVINPAEHKNYFSDLAQRSWLVVNTINSSQTNPISNHPLQMKEVPPYLEKQKNLITALVEIPIYQHEEIIGAICCTQQQTPRVWQAAETSFLLTAACLVELAVSRARNQQTTATLNKQNRQLTLEMIERQQAEQAWQESQRFIRGILDASTNILYVNDFISGINYYVNGCMESILGYSPTEIGQFGARFLEQISHPEHVNTIHQARRKLAQSKSGDTFEHEYRLRHKHGSWRWMLCRETIFQWNEDGTPEQLLGTATDITTHKENAAALEQQNQALTALARVDALTQIANRRAFDEFLDNAWATRQHTPLTLILCDIDYFKLYNDTYGHQAGDKCLKNVAHALQTAVKRQLDLVARYGGEEFAVVLPNTSLAGAQHVAQSIQSAIGDLKIEHNLSSISNYLTLSMGVASVDSTSTGSPQELIVAADQGLYQAKSAGRAQFSVVHINSDAAEAKS